VAGGFLDVAQRHAGVERGGDERVPEGMRTDLPGDAGPTRDATDDPSCGVTVEAFTLRCDEDGAFTALAHREVDRARGARRERDGDDLATVAQDRQRAVASFEAKGLDVGASGFGDPQAVQSQQADECMIACTPMAGRHEQGTDFVAIEAGRVPFLVEAWPAHMHRQRRSGRSGRSTRSCIAAWRSSPALDRESGVPANALMSARRALKQANLMFVAPDDVLTQIQRVGVAGESAVAGQNADQRGSLLRAETGRIPRRSS